MSGRSPSAGRVQLPGRGAAILFVLVVAIALGLPGGKALAGPPADPLAQYKHVSWPMEGGAPSRINAITQSKDGYLWIGSVDGLFRFDGVAFEPVQPDTPQPGRLVVSQVLGARSGEVWVGLARSGGVAVYRDGRLRDAGMPHPSREVTALVEDPQGGVWVARGGRMRDTLARYWRGRWQEIGADAGLPEEEVWQILFTRDGALWVVLTDTIVRRPPGAIRFQPTGVSVTRRASIAEDASGRVWLSDAAGTRLLPSRGAASASSKPAYGQAEEIGGTRIMFDRRGDLWGATWTDGVFQISSLGVAADSASHRPARARPYKAVNGLTSDQTHAVFEDHEGDIWVGTELGLDMLRPASVVVEPAIPPNSSRSYRMATTENGVVYIADAHALYAIDPGKTPRPIFHSDWPPGSLCTGRDNSVWLTLRTTVLHIRGGRSERLPMPELKTFGCAEDREGRLWMPALDKGLYWREHHVWRQWPGLSASVGLPSNAALDADGRADILFRTAPHLKETPPFQPLFKERFKIGGLEGVLPGRTALFVGGAQGLAKLAGGRVQSLGADTYPWLASVNGLVQTPAGDTWTVGDAGIVRMNSAALDRAFDHPGAPLDHQVFDFRDGLNSFAQKSPGPQIAVGGDGRVWILTRRNVVAIDPSRIAPNRLAPPVAIRWLTVDGRRYRDPSDLELPAGTTNLAIDYTALSLAVPSRVQFRYRLEGIDRDWIDPGPRRQAVYNNLHPGRFRFRVKAANDNGVWNETGATLQISIPPTLTQTWLFRIACAVIAALILWLIYRLRLRQVAGQLRLRLEERAAERERIARELHDTLLQSVQGLIMRFQSVADHIADDQPAKAVIDHALDRADQMLVEGRDRVRDLRRHDPRRLDVILRELAHEQPFDAATRVEVVSEGAPRDIRPVVQEEIVRIAGEALFNAARHAHAREVQLKVVYGLSRLQISLRDDGVGIGATGHAWAARDGHYGLIGMQERARKVGAQLAIESAPGAGAAIALTLPAAIAYQAQPWIARFRAMTPWRRAALSRRRL